MPYRNPISSLIQYFMPVNRPLVSIEEGRRARLVIGASLLLCTSVTVVVLSLMAFVYGAMERKSGVGEFTALLFGALMLCNAFLVKYAKDLKLPSYILVFGFAFTTIFVVINAGGTASSVMMIKGCVLLLAFLLLGTSGGLLMGCVFLADLALLLALHSHGVIRAEIHTSPMLRSIVYLLQLSMLGGIGILFEMSRQTATKALEESHQEKLELAVSRDAALQANLAKSEFLASMSHELRTPLNAIIGYTELLLEDPDPDELKEDLSRIQLAGHHLLDLINDVLDLAKIEAGQMALSADEIELSSFLRQIADTVEGMAKAKDNEFVLDCASTLPILYSDTRRLRQILLNLLSNATKFTNEGKISLRVGCVGEGISFAVEDTGIGMDESQLERMFQKFTQADPSSTRRYGGTGLGLAISKELCRMMGGRIEVTSELGVGSIFTLWLPLVPKEAGEGRTGLAP